MTYICSNCGKSFSRKSSFKDNLVLCNGCLISKRKLEEFQKPEKKQHFIESTVNTNNNKYGCDNVAQADSVKKKHAHRDGFTVLKYQEKIQKAAHSESAMTKKTDTNLDRYGATHFMKTTEGVKRQQDAYFEKTGFRTPMHNPEVVKKNHTSSYLYKDIYFDSSWELAFYIWLSDNKKDFIYHPPFFMDYIDDEGVLRKYEPDFLIEGQFYEIKGDQFFNEKGEPYNGYKKEYWWEKYKKLQENKVVILKFEDVKIYLKYIKETYGKDFLKQFKIKSNDYRNTNK